MRLRDVYDLAHVQVRTNIFRGVFAVTNPTTAQLRKVLRRKMKYQSPGLQRALRNRVYAILLHRRRHQR